MEIKWSVVMVMPGEDELSLLAELSHRKDAQIIGIVDPDGFSVGAGLAEILGVTVYPDLASIPPGKARFLVHPPLNETIDNLISKSSAYSITPVSAVNFANLLVERALSATPAPRPATTRSNFDFLETETSAIHETLGRIEEALDREGLLRWLLKLSTKATGAGSGSIMLFDEATQELYVAFAHGLSQTTLHRTRVRIGDGISGRVASTGKAEIIRGNQKPGSQRDRMDLQSSICAPIMWQDKLLGILNLSTSAGDQDLTYDALSTVENLTHRFGMILHRFLRLQTVRDGEVFRKIEEDLNNSSLVPLPVNSTLCDWAENLTEITQADYLSLSILTADGDLLVADAEDVHYESPPAPEKDAVLASGSPLVLRPTGDDIQPNGDDSTIFHLPVGRGPTRALMTLVYHTASRAHHFHTLSAEAIYLVNRHLSNFLDKSHSNDQMDRLTTLASTLTDLSTLAAGDQKSLMKRTVSAACQLTGAQQACILNDESELADCLDGPMNSEMRQEAVRLLKNAGNRGWSSTTMMAARAPGATEAPQSLMAVPLNAGLAFPGLILLNKKRLHPLDGASFTEFDALFARRLLPVFHAHCQATAPNKNHTPTASEYQLSVQETESSPASKNPAPQLAQIHPPAARVTADIRKILGIEIDRCKRYHTMVGLAAFRVTPTSGMVPDLTHLVSGLQTKLRSSDQTGCLKDGTILIVVPEDIQSLPSLLKRATSLLKNISGQDDLLIQTASRVYPGAGKNSEELIDAVIKAIN